MISRGMGANRGLLVASAWISCVEGAGRLGAAGRKVTVCVQYKASEGVSGPRKHNSYLPGRENIMIAKVVFPG